MEVPAPPAAHGRGERDRGRDLLARRHGDRAGRRHVADRAPARSRRRWRRSSSHRHELGVHSELIFGGIPALVDAGVITGARKTVHPGKVVGASFGPLTRGRVRAGRWRPALRAVLHEPHERHPGDRRARQHVRRQQRAAGRPDGPDQRRDDRPGDLQRHRRRVRVRRRRAAREERPQRDGAAVDVASSTASGARASCRCSRRAAP